MLLKIREYKITKAVNNELLRDVAEPAFYFLTDHLGSSSYITNDNGQVTQTMSYTPFGEWQVDFVNFNASPCFATTYKFSGKEKDEETGFGYFGARYYYDYLSIWLSTDPLADKYPSLSPYVYCANNPIKLIDPNGKEIWINGEDGTRTQYTKNMEYKGNDGFTKDAIKALNKIRGTKIGGRAVNELETSKNVFNIQKSEKNQFDVSTSPKDALKGFSIQYLTDQSPQSSLVLQHLGADYFSDMSGAGGDILWNPNGSLQYTADGKLSSNPTTDLGHELFHALDANRGLMDDRIYDGLPRNEWQASYGENLLRQELGVPFRVSYPRNEANGTQTHIGQLKNNKPIVPGWSTWRPY
ncbi:MAG: hypothetical protein LBL74_04825 [Bacteroidales bacterium]|jgi:RHS repeat-associated protein|nr:hypothetical protein [Bacteroidales bacterium]